MTTNGVRQILLEVERKFSHLRHYPLTQDGGSPPFRSLHHLGRHTFRDVYYDHQGRLAAAGTWVRQRNGKWQSKIRQAGDFRNSSFRETSDTSEIGSHISSIINLDTSELRQAPFGLHHIADITTHREVWKADDRFTITLDRTDFNHVVGEVELEEHVPVTSDEDTSRISRAMDRDIASFMQRYHWAFDSSPPVGKLTAYFNQYELEKSAVKV